jgi:hypothetical protein
VEGGTRVISGGPGYKRDGVSEMTIVNWKKGKGKKMRLFSRSINGDLNESKEAPNTARKIGRFRQFSLFNL